MTYGNILILNGASSAGKTSLLRALQTLLPEPYLEAGIDKFIWMLPERYLERPWWDDVLGKPTEAGETGHQLVKSMHRAMAAISRTGCHVVADHVLVEPAWVNDCAEVLADLPAYLIGIRCPTPVLEARERARKNRTLGQAAAQNAVIHRHGVYDFEVDTSQFSAEECACQIINFLHGGGQPSALTRLRKQSSPGGEN